MPFKVCHVQTRKEGRLTEPKQVHDDENLKAHRLDEQSVILTCAIPFTPYPELTKP
jgi:hypothetical protein